MDTSERPYGDKFARDLALVSRGSKSKESVFEALAARGYEPNNELRWRLGLPLLEKVDRVYDPDLTEEERKSLDFYLHNPRTKPQRFRINQDIQYVLVCGFGVIPISLLIFGIPENLSLFIGVLITLIFVGVMDVRREKDRVRKARGEYVAWQKGQELRNRVVTGEELDFPALYILHRAQEAAKTILSSPVHRNDEYLGEMAAQALPRHLWEIADSLRKSCELQKELDDRKAEDGRLSPVCQVQKDMVQTVRKSLRKRVKSLTAYADQVQLAQEQIAALEQDEKAHGRMDDFLSLLASTARDDKAIQEVNELAARTKDMRLAVEQLMLPLREQAESIFVDS